jgi:hypothetical protein
MLHLMQRAMLDQRNVTVQHQRTASNIEVRHCLLNCVAGPKLRFLDNEFRGILLHFFWDGLTAMTIYHTYLLRLECSRAIQYMLHQRLARQCVQHLGPVGVHSRAFSGSKYDNI